MLKHILLAATAAILSAPAFAQAPAVELEGVIQSWDNPTRTLEVMGMQVFVPDTAVIHSPAATRAATGLNLNQWFRGAAFPGRTPAGFMQGTAIVTGTWDAVAGRIVAEDIAVEPAENVALGVITASFCTTTNCDGPGDYIRGSSKVGGGAGPAMLPIADQRMAAGPVGDEGGFALSLAGVNLNGFEYVAEGYFGDIAVPTNSSTGALSERAFHYFNFDLAAPAPQLLVNKTIREVSVARADCRVGKDFEVRGFNHSRVSTTGAYADTVRPNAGVIQVQYTLNGVAVRQSAASVAIAAPPAAPAAATSPIGRYRVRFDIAGACPENIVVRWLPAATSANTLAYASAPSFPVEIRLD